MLWLVAAGARDLIPRMLLVDPLKRITIPEVRQPLWHDIDARLQGLAGWQSEGDRSKAPCSGDFASRTAVICRRTATCG
jgi:hypothetical protein